MTAGRRPPKRRPQPSSPDGARAPIVERIGPAISKVAWSPELVAQSLEIFPVFRDDTTVRWLKPIHAASLKIGLSPSQKPGDVVVDTLGWYELTPRGVHSTSWRQEDARIVLTYVAVVEPARQLPSDSLVAIAVARSDLARGEALGPPTAIGVAQVLEHALRHLAWLVKDDPVIGAALHDWSEVLSDYTPEPFRALG